MNRIIEHAARWDGDRGIVTRAVEQIVILSEATDSPGARVYETLLDQAGSRYKTLRRQIPA